MRVPEDRIRILMAERENLLAQEHMLKGKLRCLSRDWKIAQGDIVGLEIKNSNLERKVYKLKYLAAILEMAVIILFIMVVFF